jgi:hypothetical protein
LLSILSILSLSLFLFLHVLSTLHSPSPAARDPVARLVRIPETSSPDSIAKTITEAKTSKVRIGLNPSTIT